MSTGAAVMKVHKVFPWFSVAARGVIAATALGVVGSFVVPGVAHAGGPHVIPAASRARTTPVAVPEIGAACGSFVDTNFNPAGTEDVHDIDNQAAYLMRLDNPSAFPGEIVAGPSRGAMTTIDLAQHSSACVSPGNFPGGSIWPTGPTGGTNSGVARISAFINVPDTGAAGGPEDYTFGSIGNDAVRVTIGNQLVFEHNWDTASPPPADGDWKRTRHVRFAEPGVYPLIIEYTTNHICDLDPLELAYVPGLLAGVDSLGCGSFGGFGASCTGGPSPTANLDGVGGADGWRLLGDALGVLDLMASADGTIPTTDRTDFDGDNIADGDEGRFCGVSWVNTDTQDLPDAEDLDTDNDLIPDIIEAGDTDLSTPPIDTDMNGVPDFRQPNNCLTASPTTCFIGGICFPGGSVNPMNSCEECNRAMTGTGWSPRPPGTVCNDGLFCTVDDTCTAPRVCSGNARDCNDSRACTDMERCDEVNDLCAFRLAVGCLIDGACVAAGTRNPANRCEVCDPTVASRVFRWTPLGAACDGDMDGFCPGGTDTNMDGDCDDPGETGSPGDCLDTNPAVNPAAAEICANGLDDDCDGLTDDADPECSDTATQDMDGDGFCPAGTDTNMDGDCRDPGEDTGPQDCNDANATVNPSVVEEMLLCNDGVDNDCDGLTDSQDPGCSRERDDDDGDGFCERGIDGNGDGDCRDAGEDVGPFDCDDDDMAVNPAATEDCDNMIDDDCDSLVDTDDRADCPVAPGDLDDDNDGFCENGRDGNDDGDCLDPGERGEPGDCNDADPTVNPAATEDCANGVDDDCDGATDMEDDDCASDERLDMDGDGFCPMGRDTNRDGDCLDAGEGMGAGDCDDTMAAVNPDAAEDCDNGIDDDCDGDIDDADSDCLDENLLDADGDGFCPNGLDMNDDGDCSDAGESGAGADCDDTVAMVNPDAVEDCDDTVDNDCDGDIDAADSDCAAASIDADGDGFCAGGGTDDNADGDCDDAGEDDGDADCDDTDDTVNPDADEICDDGVDNDCDGDTDEDDSECAAGDAGPTDMGMRPDAGPPPTTGGPAGGACSAAGANDSLPSALLVLLAIGFVVSTRRRRRS